MKKTTVALLVLVLSNICLYSQDTIPTFGKLTYYDFMRTYNLKDKTATACVVYESGRYSFSTDISSLSNQKVNENAIGATLEGSKSTQNLFTQDVYIRIHIMKQAGVEHGTIEIPYYYSSGYVDKLIIDGFTYNSDDSYNIIQTPLDISTIIDERVSDTLHIKKIIMPEVREGSIIELRYTHSSLYNQMPVWSFQKDIPVVYSELRYQEATDRRYAMIFKGAEKFDVYKQETEHSVTDGAGYRSSTQTQNIYTYGMKNLEAFNGDVDFLRNAIDYRVAIYPQLSSIIQYGKVIDYSTSWSVMRKDFLSSGNFGRYIKSSAKEAKKILWELGLEDLSGAEKIEAIVKYVKNNYVWDGTDGTDASKKLPAFLKAKTGNAGNINLFLAGMLQEANIEVYPVVLRLKPDGTVNRSYPFRELFNFVVLQAKADGKVYYLDATNTYAPFDMVSLNCINAEGFVIMPKSEEWVIITNPHSSTSFANTTLTINPESGVVSGDVVESYSGLDAVKYRQLYGDDRENLEAIFKDLGNFTLTEASTENFGDTELPFLIKYSFESGTEAQDGKLSINPLGHLAPKENIFTETRRQYPVDFVTKSSNSYSVSITVPEGYAVESLPASKKVDTREFSMIYSANTNGNVININAQFTFKSEVYPAADYNILKKYYGDMITAFSGNIVLRKN